MLLRHVASRDAATFHPRLLLLLPGFSLLPPFLLLLFGYHCVSAQLTPQPSIPTPATSSPSSLHKQSGFNAIDELLHLDYRYDLGSLKEHLQCPSAEKDSQQWILVGTQCYKVVGGVIGHRRDTDTTIDAGKASEARHRWNWQEAHAECQRNNASQIFRLENWSLHRQLNSLLFFPASANNEDDDFDDDDAYWTGWFIELDSKNYSSTAGKLLSPNVQLLSFDSSTSDYLNSTEPLPRKSQVGSLFKGAAARTSVFNPMWAHLEPQIYEVNSKGDRRRRVGRWCVAWSPLLRNSGELARTRVYGWHLRKCSDQLPAICQTFACLSGQYRCADNSACVSQKNLCDGVKDCVNGSDEESTSCPHPSPSSPCRIHGKDKTATAEFRNIVRHGGPQHLLEVGYTGEIHSSGWFRKDEKMPKEQIGGVEGPKETLASPDDGSEQLEEKCEWVVTSRAGTRFRLHITTTRKWQMRTGDSLMIEGIGHAVANPEGELLELMPYAKATTPTTSTVPRNTKGGLARGFFHTTSSNKIRVRYTRGRRGDSRRNDSFSFLVRYTVEAWPECHQRFESYNGSFSPPPPTRASSSNSEKRLARKLGWKLARVAPLNCAWSIRNEGGGILTVKISHFRLRAGQWLAIYDGPVEHRSLFGNFTTGDPTTPTSTPPSAYFSRAKELNFVYYSAPPPFLLEDEGEDEKENEGFLITFERSCLNQRLTGLWQGSVESLNYRFDDRHGGGAAERGEGWTALETQAKRRQNSSDDCSLLIEPPCPSSTHYQRSPSSAALPAGGIESCEPADRVGVTLVFDYVDIRSGSDEIIMNSSGGREGEGETHLREMRTRMPNVSYHSSSSNNHLIHLQFRRGAIGNSLYKFSFYADCLDPHDYLTSLRERNQQHAEAAAEWRIIQPPFNKGDSQSGKHAITLGHAIHYPYKTTLELICLAAAEPIELRGRQTPVASNKAKSASTSPQGQLICERGGRWKLHTPSNYNSACPTLGDLEQNDPRSVTTIFSSPDPAKKEGAATKAPVIAPPPICIVPTNIANGFLTRLDRVAGQLWYTCEGGYAPMMDTMVSCVAKNGTTDDDDYHVGESEEGENKVKYGQWVPAPECREVSCPTPQQHPSLPEYARNTAITSIDPEKRSTAMYTPGELWRLTNGQRVGSLAIYACFPHDSAESMLHLETGDAVKNESRGGRTEVAYRVQAKNKLVMQCYPDGKWSPANEESSAFELACLRPGCFASNVRFGRMDNTWTGVGQRTNVSCLPGLEFPPRTDANADDNKDGSPQLECLAERKWRPSPSSARLLTCEFINQCERNPEICGPHGICRPVNESFACACEPGFRFSNHSQLCEAVDYCAEGMNLCDPNAKCISGKAVAGNNHYKCECPPGYWLYNRTLAKERRLVIPDVNALVDGRSCIRARCPMPTKLPKGGVLVNGSNLHLVGSSAKLYCPRRTAPVAILTCLLISSSAEEQKMTGSLMAAKWSGELPHECPPPTTCPTPVLPNNATLFAKSPHQHRVNFFVVDDIVEFCCYGQCGQKGQLEDTTMTSREIDIGYVMIGPRALLCLGNGEWSGEVPKCVLPECSALPALIPANAGVVGQPQRTHLSIFITPPSTITIGERFAENSTARFECFIHHNDGTLLAQLPVGNATCMRSVGSGGTLEMRWSVDEYPSCGAVEELLKCEVESEVETSDVIPSVGRISLGEEVSFLCKQPGYALSDINPRRCILSTEIPLQEFILNKLKDANKNPAQSEYNTSGRARRECILNKPTFAKAADSSTYTLFFDSPSTIFCHVARECLTHRRRVQWSIVVPDKDHSRLKTPGVVSLNASNKSSITAGRAEMALPEGINLTLEPSGDLISVIHLHGKAALLSTKKESLLLLNCRLVEEEELGPRFNTTCAGSAPLIIDEVQFKIVSGRERVKSGRIGAEEARNRGGSAWLDAKLATAKPFHSDVFNSRANSQEQYALWRHTEHWKRLAGGEWTYSHTIKSDSNETGTANATTTTHHGGHFEGSNYLITPMVHAVEVEENDWLSISVELTGCRRGAKARECQVELSFFSTDQPVEPAAGGATTTPTTTTFTNISTSTSSISPPPSSFNLLGTASIAPHSRSIQFVLPRPHVWIMVVASPEVGSLKLARLRMTVIACPSIQIGHSVFSRTTASNVDKWVEGVCVNPMRSRPLSSLLGWKSTGTKSTIATALDDSGCEDSEDAFAGVLICSSLGYWMVGNISGGETKNCSALDADAFLPLKFTCICDDNATMERSDASSTICTPLKSRRAKNNFATGQQLSRLSNTPPMCLDTQPISMQCPGSVQVGRQSPNSPSHIATTPIRVPLPDIKDNDPDFRLTSLPPINYPLHYFDYPQDNFISWRVTDRHGTWAECLTRIDYVDCPLQRPPTPAAGPNRTTSPQFPPELPQTCTYFYNSAAALAEKGGWSSGRVGRRRMRRWKRRGRRCKQMGWAGAQCNEPVNLCRSAYCLNGGECRFLGAEGWNGSSTTSMEGNSKHRRRASNICSCKDGFEGRRCEIAKKSTVNSNAISEVAEKFNSKNLSQQAQCLNSTKWLNSCPLGACNPTSGECTCSEGFLKLGISTSPGGGPLKGALFCCQPSSPCSSVRCPNGGKCVDTYSAIYPGSSDFRCTCHHDANAGKLPETNVSASPFFCTASTSPTHTRHSCSAREGEANSCQNGGRCIYERFDTTRNTTMRRCICRTGFVGELCELPHALTMPCASLNGDKKCLNGGTCQILGASTSSHPTADESDDFYCTCPPGYVGERCGREVNACLPPFDTSSTSLLSITHSATITHGWRGCENGGRCVSHGPLLNMSCECVGGWVGEHCSERRDYCSEGWVMMDSSDEKEEYCLNGGICHNFFSGAVCECPPGYTGLRCQNEVVMEAEERKMHLGGAAMKSQQQKVIDDRLIDAGATFCATGDKTSEYCNISNTAACISSRKNNTPLCICRQGYYGTTCSESVDLCSLEGLCLNNGTCLMPQSNSSHSSYSCRCEAGYRGVNCELVATDEDERKIDFDYAADGINAVGDAMRDVDTSDTSNSSSRISGVSAAGRNSVRKGKGAPPRLLHCLPSTLRVIESRRLIQVEWNDSVEWMFAAGDGGPLVSLEANFRSGQSFAWGEHHVVYIARDALGQTAICEFDVVIAPHHCFPPSYEANTTSISMTFPSDLELPAPHHTSSYQVVVDEVQCIQPKQKSSRSGVEGDDLSTAMNGPRDESTTSTTLIFPHHHQLSPFYTCDWAGRWDRFRPEGVPFTLPSCVPAMEMTQCLESTVQMDSCDQANSTLEKLIDVVKQTLTTLTPLGQSSTCDVGKNGNHCLVVDHTLVIDDGDCRQISKNYSSHTVRLDVNEHDSSENVVKRAISSSNVVTAKPTFLVRISLTVNSTRPHLEQAFKHSLREAFSSKFTLMPTRFYCPYRKFPRLVRQSDQFGRELLHCATCAAGEAWQPSEKMRRLNLSAANKGWLMSDGSGTDESAAGGGSCVKCPADSFKPKAGVGPCTLCPVGTTTGNVTGCIGANDCYLECPPGRIYDYVGERCTKCPKGTYMPYRGRLKCYPCPLNATTPTTGAASIEQCSIVCQAGEEMTPEEECSPCELGTYRSSGPRAEVACRRCPLGFTTQSTGAKSLVECNQIFCPIGFYRRPSSSSYPLLPYGYVNDALGLPATAASGSPTPPIPTPAPRPSLLDVCAECPLGFYQPTPNATRCQRCPVGKTTPRSGCRSPLDCNVAHDLSCVPSDWNSCAVEEGWVCAEVPLNPPLPHEADLILSAKRQARDGRYECRQLFTRRHSSNESNPTALWAAKTYSPAPLWLLLAASVIITAALMVGLAAVLHYRKRWLLMAHAHCPQWVCCLCGCVLCGVGRLGWKMTVDDLSNNNFTRDPSTVIVSRDMMEEQPRREREMNVQNSNAHRSQPHRKAFPPTPVRYANKAASTEDDPITAIRFGFYGEMMGQSQPAPLATPTHSLQTNASSSSFFASSDTTCPSSAAAMAREQKVMVPLSELRVQTRDLCPAHRRPTPIHHYLFPAIAESDLYSVDASTRASGDHLRSTSAIGRRIFCTNEWGEETEYFGFRRNSPRVALDSADFFDLEEIRRREDFYRRDDPANIRHQSKQNGELGTSKRTSTGMEAEKMESGARVERAPIEGRVGEENEGRNSPGSSLEGSVPLSNDGNEGPSHHISMPTKGFLENFAQQKKAVVSYDDDDDAFFS